jgi:SWI/SNF-related matrix-associated actin-dependent regulator of chromatin subfamily D
MIRYTDIDTTFRRAGPMPQHAQLQSHQPTHQQLQHQAVIEAQRRELARRQSRKPTDRNLPDDLGDITIGEGPAQYTKLREAERRLDAVMMRKRLDVQNSSHRHSKRYRTMRIWISNTVENQPWQQSALETDAFDFNPENQGTYKVRIEGRLLPEEDETEEDETEKEKEKEGEDADAMETDGDAKKPTPKSSKLGPSQRTKLSHFFKRITVDFDRSKSWQPDGFQVVEWKGPNADSKPQDKGHRPFQISAKPEHNFDSLEFERKGDENINVTISLFIDEYPERFKLSPELAAVLDTDEDERSGVVMGIWNYIKANSLQDEEDTRLVHCDGPLKSVCISQLDVTYMVPGYCS